MLTACAWISFVVNGVMFFAVIPAAYKIIRWTSMELLKSDKKCIDLRLKSEGDLTVKCAELKEAEAKALRLLSLLQRHAVACPGLNSSIRILGLRPGRHALDNLTKKLQGFWRWLVVALTNTKPLRRP